MTPTEVAAALRQFPGVRDAAVVSREIAPEKKELVAYIVADAAHLDALLSGTEEERKRLQKWRKTFDLMQLGKEAASAPLAFNIAGWNSSYTRQPIPTEEMREWVDETVRSIQSLQPREVLEIGCGTGLLLLRVAPACKRYVATDFSPAVLKRLREQLVKLEKPLEGVTLFERSADDLEDFAPASFDTVIVNSVVQYFPGSIYLFHVLKKLTKILKPGGRIFLGDVRSLPLLESYAVSVEIFQASSSTTLSELRDRTRRRIQTQGELLLSPSFFLLLQKRLPDISLVEIRPKLGRTDNELTRFRFDAVLTIAGKESGSFEPSWIDWTPDSMNIETVRQMLAKPECAALAIRGVPNARIENDLRAAREIAAGDGSRTAGELKELLDKRTISGIHPRAVWDMAEQFGFSLDWSWLNSRSDGSFDLFFQRVSANATNPQRIVRWPRPASVSGDLPDHSNTPGQSILGEKLIHALAELSKDRFPAAMLPAAFMLVDLIPRLPSGEPDTSALSMPGAP